VMDGIGEALIQRTIARLPLAGSEGWSSEFLVAPGDLEFEPRGPLPGGTVRDIDHICDQEIEAGVVRVVRAMVGASKEEVTTATARAFLTWHRHNIRWY